MRTAIKNLTAGNSEYFPGLTPFTFTESILTQMVLFLSHFLRLPLPCGTCHSPTDAII